MISRQDPLTAGHFVRPSAVSQVWKIRRIKEYLLLVESPTFWLQSLWKLPSSTSRASPSVWSCDVIYKRGLLILISHPLGKGDRVLPSFYPSTTSIRQKNGTYKKMTNRCVCSSSFYVIVFRHRPPDALNKHSFMK